MSYGLHKQAPKEVAEECRHSWAFRIPLKDDPSKSLFSHQRYCLHCGWWSDEPVPIALGLERYNEK